MDKCIRLGARNIGLNPLFSYNRLSDLKPPQQQLDHVNRLQACLRDGITPHSLTLLKQAFLQIPDSMRTGVYVATGKSLESAFSHAKIVWSVSKNGQKQHPPLKLEGEDIEKINSVFATLEEVLGIDQGYRITWISPKKGGIFGIAKDYAHQGVQVREYFQVEDKLKISNPISGEKTIEGMVDDQNRIILLFFPEGANDLAGPFLYAATTGSLIKECEVLSKITQAIREISGAHGSRQFMNVYYSLGRSIVLEHEFGHISARKKHTQISHVLKPASSIDEIMADLEGPLRLIEETFRSDADRARQLFWTLFYKRFNRSMSTEATYRRLDQQKPEEDYLFSASDLLKFIDFDDEFLLKFMLLSLKPGKGIPEIDPERLRIHRERIISQICTLMENIPEADANSLRTATKTLELVEPKETALSGLEINELVVNQLKEMGF